MVPAWCQGMEIWSWGGEKDRVPKWMGQVKWGGGDRKVVGEIPKVGLGSVKMGRGNPKWGGEPQNGDGEIPRMVEETPKVERGRPQNGEVQRGGSPKRVE